MRGTLDAYTVVLGFLLLGRVPATVPKSSDERFISLVELHSGNRAVADSHLIQKTTVFRESETYDIASSLAFKRKLYARQKVLRQRRDSVSTEAKNSTHPWTIPQDLSVLVVRVGLGDLYPDYCNEQCAFDLMWSNTSTEHLKMSHTVSKAIESTSYGKVRVPQSLGRVVTVPLSVDDSSDYIITQCMPWVIAALVQDQLVSTFGIRPTDYSHMVLILPRQVDCAWEGTAWVGCDSSPCKAWVRTDNPMTLFHELGHTLGLHHSGLDTNDDGVAEDLYGDGTSIMGHKVYTGFNAAQRAQLGYISLASVYHLSVVSPGVTLRYTLRSIDLSPDSRRGFSIIQLSRGVEGGIYHISFNAGESGIDVNLPSGLAGRVYVHYNLQGDLSTRLVSALNTEEVFTSTHEGFRLIVETIDLDEGVATVVLKGAGTSDGDTDTKNPGASASRVYLPQCSDTVTAPSGNGSVDANISCFKGSVDTLCQGRRVSYHTALNNCVDQGFRLCTPEEVSHLPVRSCVDSGELTSDRAAWTNSVCGLQQDVAYINRSHFVTRIGLGWMACVNSSTVLGLQVCCRGQVDSDSHIIATSSSDNQSITETRSESSLEQETASKGSGSAVGIGVCIGLICGLFLWGITTYARAHSGGYLCLTKEQRRAMEQHRRRKQSACANLLEIQRKTLADTNAVSTHTIMEASLAVLKAQSGLLDLSFDSMGQELGDSRLEPRPSKTRTGKRKLFGFSSFGSRGDRELSTQLISDDEEEGGGDASATVGGATQSKNRLAVPKLTARKNRLKKKSHTADSVCTTTTAYEQDDDVTTLSSSIVGVGADNPHYKARRSTIDASAIQQAQKSYTDAVAAATRRSSTSPPQAISRRRSNVGGANSREKVLLSQDTNSANSETYI
eukprot:m.55904 g.55904  ORF g.55904 m.55904 type:complete len:895 (-) comp15553_c0_seq3:179-2863(-)